MNILLVDDHTLFAGGMKNLLEAGGFTVVGIVRDGIEAMTATRKLHPDLILMDITMPGCDGLTATRLIKAEFPEIKIVMLTMNDVDTSLFEAIRSGASGYLLKNLETDELFSCLEQLANGETVFSPGMADRLLHEFDSVGGKKSTSKTAGRPLSSRQEEILINIASGMNYKDVAERLGIGSRTIKYHMGEILDRLHLDNRAQAIAYISGATRGKR